MSRLTNHALRAGASALGVAAGLMVLASTTQTRDGFTQASFGGPLDIFTNSSAQEQADVLAIGDGVGDANELAAILNGPLLQTSPNSPYRVAYEAGGGANGLSISSLPAIDPAAGAPTSKQALSLPPNPVVDAQGRVNCSGAVSCLTDPITNVTTVTYANGVVAVVQQINELTVVAYKTLVGVLPQPIQELFPAVKSPTPLAAPMPAAATPVTPQVEAPVADLGPAAPVDVPEISASTVRPRITVTRSPQDLIPGQSGSSKLPSGIKIPDLKPINPVDVVKDAFNSIVNAVTGKGNHPSKTKVPDADATPASGSASRSAGQDATGRSGQ